MKRMPFLVFLALLMVFPIMLFANTISSQDQNFKGISIASITSSMPDNVGMPANVAMDQQRTENIVMGTNSVNLVAQTTDSQTSLAVKCIAMVAESNCRLLLNEIAKTDNDNWVAQCENMMITTEPGYNLKCEICAGSIAQLNSAATGTHGRKTSTFSTAPRRTDYNKSPGAGHRPI